MPISSAAGDQRVDPNIFPKHLSHCFSFAFRKIFLQKMIPLLYNMITLKKKKKNTHNPNTRLTTDDGIDHTKNKKKNVKCPYCENLFAQIFDKSPSFALSSDFERLEAAINRCGEMRKFLPNSTAACVSSQQPRVIVA